MGSGVHSTGGAVNNLNVGVHDVTQGSGVSSMYGLSMPVEDNVAPMFKNLQLQNLLAPGFESGVPTPSFATGVWTPNIASGVWTPSFATGRSTLVPNGMSWTNLQLMNLKLNSPGIPTKTDYTSGVHTTLTQGATLLPPSANIAPMFRNL